MPAMSEAAARTIAVLRRQAIRHRAQAGIHAELEATGLDLTGLVTGRPQDHHDKAALTDLAADLAERHARAKQALVDAYQPVLRARVDAAVAQYAAGSIDLAGLREAFTLRHEDACPAEYAAVAAAARELQETARTWRLIGSTVAGDGKGGRPVQVEDHVDDTPDPAEVARLLEG